MTAATAGEREYLRWFADFHAVGRRLDLNAVRLLQSGLSVVDARIRIGRVPGPAPSRRIAY
jgi:hypothetical protein